MIDFAAALMAAGSYDPLNDQINRLQQANTNAMNVARGLGQGQLPWESMAELQARAAREDIYRQVCRDQIADRPIGRPATYSTPVPQPEPALNPVLLLLE